MTISTRRTVMHGAALVAAGALAGSGSLTPSRARAQGAAGLPMPDVKALVFDTFGTVVDWRNGVAREARTILSPLGFSLDWLAFADAWRAQYQPGMDEVRTGHVGRPGEGGPGTGETEPKGQFDVVGKNFHDFADKLGV